jgi:hypothetical protein
VGSERLGKRNNHQRGEEERSENAKRGENAGHGRTILRAATKPALPDNSTPPSAKQGSVG